MSSPSKYAIIILAGIFITFIWMLPVVAGGMLVGWLARGKAEPYLRLFKEVMYEQVSDSEKA
jgi:hypothetical protein